MLTLVEASARFSRREITSLSLTDACLARIAIYDSKLDAFITVAGEQARTLDAELKSGNYLGPLHGIPIAIKDNIDTVNLRTTGGSALFAAHVPTADAPVDSQSDFVARILRFPWNFAPFRFCSQSVIDKVAAIPVIVLAHPLEQGPKHHPKFIGLIRAASMGIGFSTSYRAHHFSQADIRKFSFLGGIPL